MTYLVILPRFTITFAQFYGIVILFGDIIISCYALGVARAVQLGGCIFPNISRLTTSLLQE